MKYSSYRLGSQFVARSRFGLLKFSVTKSDWIPLQSSRVLLDTPILAGLAAVEAGHDCSASGVGTGYCTTVLYCCTLNPVVLLYSTVQ